jgi:hypothetical protein
MRHDGRNLLAGDPRGEAVLRELTDDPAPHVQALANFGLQRLQSADGSDSAIGWMVRYTVFDAR